MSLVQSKFQTIKYVRKFDKQFSKLKIIIIHVHEDIFRLRHIYLHKSNCYFTRCISFLLTCLLPLTISIHDCRQINVYQNSCTRLWYRTKYMYFDANLVINLWSLDIVDNDPWISPKNLSPPGNQQQMSWLHDQWTIRFVGVKSAYTRISLICILYNKLDVDIIDHHLE